MQKSSKAMMRKTASKPPTKHVTTTKSSRHSSTKTKKTLKTKKRSSTTTTTSTITAAIIPKPILTKSMRRMGVMRRAPTEAGTMQDVAIASKRREDKLIPKAAALAQQSDELEKVIEKEYFNARVQANRQKRHTQPDEMSVKYTCFLLTAAIEHEAQIRQALRSILFENEDGDYQGLDTKFNQTRGLITSLAENIIVHRSSDTGLRFASRETLQLCVSNFPLIWSMYTEVGTNTDTISVEDPSILGPISSNIVTKNTTKLHYAELDDSFWAVTMNACFGMDLETFKKAKHFMDVGEARKLLTKQLNLAQSPAFAAEVQATLSKIGIEKPDQRYSTPDERVNYYTASRSLSHDLLAQHTVDSFLGSFGFQPSEIGYFLMRKALDGHCLADPIATNVSSMLTKQLEGLCPIYVTQQELMSVLGKQKEALGGNQQIDYNEPDFTPEQIEEAKQYTYQAQLSQKEADRLISEKKKARDPFYVRQMMDNLPPRPKVLAPHPADKKRFDTVKSSYTPHRKGKLERPETRDEFDFSLDKLPGASEDEEIAEYNRDPNAFISGIEQRMSGPKYKDNPAIQAEVASSARFRALFTASTPKHPGAGQSEGAPLAQFQHVAAQTRATSPEIPQPAPGTQPVQEFKVPHRERAPVGGRTAAASRSRPGL